MKHFGFDLPNVVGDEEENDYEARDCLSTLLRADAIQNCGDEDLLGRITTEAHRQAAAIERVSNLLSGLSCEEEDQVADLIDRPDSRTIDDFLARLNRSRKEEYTRNMMPLKGKGSYS